jgi:3-deoxy-7-phosphoheptulonate synthase
LRNDGLKVAPRQAAGKICDDFILWKSLLGRGPRKGMAMIISMKRHATREEIDAVTSQVNHFGYKVHSIEGEERVVIGVVGVGDVTACLESIEAMPQVENVMRISAPYKFVSKEFRKEKTLVRVNGAVIGGDEFVVIAGPCSVESEEQILRSAEGVAKAGAKLLRGGAFKPRTSPYDFQGMEEEGLKLLQKAKRATGLGIVTEVMSDRDVDLVANYADVLQIGARNMQNFVLLKALGKCGRPILLKRGLSSTVKELLMSAEYIVAHGNPEVMLCERGIRTFETVTRNTCDITAIPALNELTHLPVILDPSHATGKRSLVPALARAGVAIGADALIVEVHPAPEKAISDGAQSLDVPQFAKMMEGLKPYIELWKDSRKRELATVESQ